MSQIPVIDHMSCVKNLEVISRNFVILVQQGKTEKILETLRYVGFNFDKCGAT